MKGFSILIDGNLLKNAARFKLLKILEHKGKELKISRLVFNENFKENYLSKLSSLEINKVIYIFSSSRFI